MTDATLETDMDRSYRQWRENADHVAADPTGASAHDLRRAIHYLTHKRASIVHRAQQVGRSVDSIVDAINSEIEWYQRLADNAEWRTS